MPDLPIDAFVPRSGEGVTYVYADGHTVTLHGNHPYRDKARQSERVSNMGYSGGSGGERALPVTPTISASAIGIDGSLAVGI